MKKFLICLLLCFSISCFAETDPTELKALLENKTEVINLEIKTLKAKLKYDKNDYESISNLETKKIELENIKKELDIVKDAISCQKELNETLKKYESTKSKFNTLNKQVESIYKKESQNK